MEKRAVIIVGSGPAGVSTALSLMQSAPHLASELLVLEKAQHPRPKLCGGGLTAYADELLDKLGVKSQTPSFPIHKVRFRFDSKPINFCGKNLMRIVRRDEFDSDLVQQARRLGVEVRENQRVSDLRRVNGALEIRTDETDYRTKVVVGADGANSFVRRRTISADQPRVSRLIEALVKADLREAKEFEENMAVFDFRCVKEALHGYFWDFPSLIEDQPYLNIGLFDSGIHGSRRANLKRLLVEKLERRGIAHGEVEIMGHPERWFSPKGRYSCPNILLVGDAAGIEPWLGEGISMALAYGPIAAQAIRNAFEKNDFGFENYNALIIGNKLGRLLRRNRIIAKCFYTTPSQALLSRLARVWEAYFNSKFREL